MNVDQILEKLKETVDLIELDNADIAMLITVYDEAYQAGRLDGIGEGYIEGLRDW